VPELLAAGCRVRVLARHPDRLRDHPWTDDVEIVQADVSDPATLGPAVADVDVAYYLVHALGTAAFENTDRANAETFAAAARDAGVGRLVYLGGLTPDPSDGGHLSAHLRSRDEVAQILLASGVPTVVLRAAVIIGSGSASFEMLRYLTERLPAMITPRWLKTRIQPIAIRDVLRYLVGCARLPADVHRSFDIGGPDVLTYRDMMVRYAAVAGLPRRLIVPVPVLTPWLSSHWVGLVTPVPSSWPARSWSHSAPRWCAASTTSPTTSGPTRRPARVRAGRRAGTGADQGCRRGHPLVVGVGARGTQRPAADRPGLGRGSSYVDGDRAVGGLPGAVWRVIEGIGGRAGVVLLPGRVAGARHRRPADRRVGLRRGRRHPDRCPSGRRSTSGGSRRGGERHAAAARRDAAAGPGLAGARRRTRRADLDVRAARRLPPRGLLGHLYWWGVAPFHGIVFGGMARNIAAAAEASQSPDPAPAGAAELTSRWLQRAALEPGRPLDVPVGPAVAGLEVPRRADDLHDVADVGLVEEPDRVGGAHPDASRG
jgi:uncharacterized protein YbjT (DUF2867 family)